MKRLHRYTGLMPLAIAATWLILAGCAVPLERARLEHGVGHLDRELQGLERRGFVGQVAVVHGDQILLLSGYGRMAPGSPEPVTAESVMPLASLTKPFTASAVLALAAEGRLALDEPIGAYVPALSGAWADVPIRYYLTHTTGLPGEIINRNYNGQPRFEPVARETFVKRLAQFEPDHQPGARFGYSNVGYNLLAVMVEVITGQDFESFLSSTLLRPAGVADIGFELPDWCATDLVVGRRGREAIGHYLDRPRLDNGLGWNLRGAGDLLARPRGIIDWWHAIRDGRWLSMPWQERWLKPRVRDDVGSRYGYGLDVRNGPYGRIIGHTGGDSVYAVDFSWFIDHDLMVYIATANSGYLADVMRDRLHEMLLK